MCNVPLLLNLNNVNFVWSVNNCMWQNQSHFWMIILTSLFNIYLLPKVLPFQLCIKWQWLVAFIKAFFYNIFCLDKNQMRWHCDWKHLVVTESLRPRKLGTDGLKNFPKILQSGRVKAKTQFQEINHRSPSLYYIPGSKTIY